MPQDFMLIFFSVKCLLFHDNKKPRSQIKNIKCPFLLFSPPPVLSPPFLPSFLISSFLTLAFLPSSPPPFLSFSHLPPPLPFLSPFLLLLLPLSHPNPLPSSLPLPLSSILFPSVFLQAGMKFVPGKEGQPLYCWPQELW